MIVKNTPTLRWKGEDTTLLPNLVFDFLEVRNSQAAVKKKKKNYEIGTFLGSTTRLPVMTHYHSIPKQ